MADQTIQVVWCQSIDAWPGGLRPGALLLAIDATDVPPEKIAAVARGCLDGPLGVVVCWGPDCERVHDIFDEVEVMAQIDGGQAPDVDTVMTTWHRDEPLDEAFDMLRLQIDFLQPARPHIAVVVGERRWLAQAEDLGA